MKVLTILILVISTSLAARISDRGSRRLDATKQERLKTKPSGSFNIQLQGGHISRVDFGSQNTKKEEPNRTQSRTENHRFSSQPTTKRPFSTHKALSNSGSARLQKRNNPSESTFNFNRQNANSQLNHPSSFSVPSHFTVQQQRKPDNSHMHFNPPVVNRPAEQKRPVNHFNIPVVARPVEHKRPHNHFNPPVAVRPLQLDRPANAHFSPATFNFGSPSPSKASSRRPANFHRSSHSTSSTRRPESSVRSSSNLSPRRPDSSHRAPVTPKLFTPKGVSTSNFLPPKFVVDDTDEFGPVDNSIQTPILSPNQPTSAKDIPTIFYPINPKIGPSNRAKA